MLSNEMLQCIEDGFRRATPYMGELKESIMSQLASCTEEEQILLKFYYGSMPYSDVADVEFELLKKYAGHALFVREHCAWCSKVPEQIFLTDVAAYRINNEKIVDCRDFFYHKLIDRVKRLSVEDAVLEVNYWCAENATYQAADFRTASPITVYLSGKGRCGEESVLLVSALRSLGIPARQVYTPRWAHCDSNHAWVEVWCNGRWMFLGACEPEAVLNKGWFTGPASRAMLIHNRYFTNIPVSNTISREGLVTFTNNTGLYAKTVPFRVQVVDQDRKPLPDTEIRLELLNSAIYTPIAIKRTDARGWITVELGKGSLRLHIRRDGKYQVENVATESEQVQIIFTGRKEPEGRWSEYELEAPMEVLIHPGKVTEEQAEENARRMEEAKRIRESRLESYYIEEKARRYPEAEKLLKASAGNFNEVYRFLDKDSNPYRIPLLKALSGKDLLDLNADVLEEHLASACIYASRYTGKDSGKSTGRSDDKHSEDREEDIFSNYILNPRIEYEELTCYRRFINEFFTSEQKAAFSRNPLAIWEYIGREIGYDETRDYGTLRISPVGALKLRLASQDSRKILFTAICRSLGIPARLNPMDGTPEYYDGSSFLPVRNGDACGSAVSEKATLTLTFEKDKEWEYYSSWTLGRMQDGSFETLHLSDIPIKNNRMQVELEEGEYRLLITTRKPSGNQMVRECYFTLRNGAEREITMEHYRELIEDILIHRNVDIFAFHDRMGNVKDSMTDYDHGRRIYIWLEEGKEPTEHILNELMEAKNRCEPIVHRVKLLIKDWSVTENPTLKRTLEIIQGLQCFVPQDWKQINSITKQLDMQEGKLPLALVIDTDGSVIYATCGYNVGSVNLMLKLL